MPDDIIWPPDSHDWFLPGDISISESFNQFANAFDITLTYTYPHDQLVRAAQQAGIYQRTIFPDRPMFTIKPDWEPITWDHEGMAKAPR